MSNTYASKWPQRTAAYPHSNALFSFRSFHSTSMAKKDLSFFSHTSRIALGSPLRTRDLRAESTAAGSVEWSFLYEE